VIEQSLPDGRGIDLTETLHASSDVPILLLHDAHDEMQTIMTLDRGADDVLSRPFGLGELAARIHALIRRYERVLRYLQFAELALQGVSGSAQNDEMFVVDTGARIITMNGEPLSLTSKEFELLSLFLQNPGRVFAKNELYSRLWDSEFEGDTRTVMVYISRLRKKIELHPEKPEMLINVWGLGYKYNPC
jgi:DNA-binding response OmpR family regulator